MPDEDSYQQEILPPTPIESVMWGAVDVTDEMRDVVQQSLLWTGLDDDERQRVIECEMALTAKRKRDFHEWVQIGEGLFHFQEEVRRQSNSTSNRGKRYNQFWKRLAPPKIRSLKYKDRSLAVDLWRARDAVSTWWEEIPEEKRNQRDRWNHPSTILRHSEKARQTAVNYPLTDETDEQHPHRHTDTNSHRGQAAAIDEATHMLHGTVEELRDVVRNFPGVSPSLLFDLSTPEMIHESADNFLQVYGGVHGDAAVQQFTEALRDNNDNWLPGSNWFNDEIEEVAKYQYQLDRERAVKISKAILKLDQQLRRRERRRSTAAKD